MDRELPPYWSIYVADRYAGGLRLPEVAILEARNGGAKVYPHGRVVEWASWQGTEALIWITRLGRIYGVGVS